MFFKKKRQAADSSDIRKIVEESGLSHIAFIMDGNGRWAKKRGLVRQAGHGVGAQTFKKVVTLCKDFGIKTVTVYAFSTENWKRPEAEVAEIMRLLDVYIKTAEDENDVHKARYIFLGDKGALSPELREKCIYLENFTRDNPITVNIALNYGGRDEIVHAVNSLIAEGRTEISEDDISSRLYTFESPEPDLIVRTGGEYRVSNFLMWQSAYSEFYFTDCLWPDFGEDELRRAIIEFSRRQRRYGGV